jgi:hypothetical protein
MQATAAAEEAKSATEAAAGRLASAAEDLEASDGEESSEEDTLQQQELLHQLRSKVVVLQEQLMVLAHQMTRMAQASPVLGSFLSPLPAIALSCLPSHLVKYTCGLLRRACLAPFLSILSLHRS